MRKEIVIGLIALIAIITFGVLFFADRNNTSTEEADALTQNGNVQGTTEQQQAQGNNTNTQTDTASAAPEMEIDPEQPYRAILKTSEGEIGIRLHADKTPITVNNFIHLARSDFYDNTIFHRVVQDFMIQGGDPNGDGTGGPGYTFENEEFEGEYTKGVVAMANRGRDTNGSQFFIMHSDTALEKNYVIFGEVDRGLDVVDTIALSEVEQAANGEMSKPVNPVIIEDVEIREE
jgi:peptidylprolyl isomerase